MDAYQSPHEKVAGISDALIIRGAYPVFLPFLKHFGISKSKRFLVDTKGVLYLLSKNPPVKNIFTHKEDNLNFDLLSEFKDRAREIGRRDIENHDNYMRVLYRVSATPTAPYPAYKSPTQGARIGFPYIFNPKDVLKDHQAPHREYYELLCKQVLLHTYEGFLDRLGRMDPNSRASAATTIIAEEGALVGDFNYQPSVMGTGGERSLGVTYNVLETPDREKTAQEVMGTSHYWLG